MRLYIAPILITVLLLCACSRSNRPKPSGEASPVLPDSLSIHDRYQQARVDDDWVVGSLSQRPKDKEQFVEVFAYRRISGRWVKVFSVIRSGAYDPRLEIRPDMTFRGSPLVLFHMQFGAAAESLEVFTINQGTLTGLQSMLAGAFEWSFDQQRSTVLLCAIPGSPVDPTEYFNWNGESFIPFSGKVHR
jgi:hypothetical protein